MNATIIIITAVVILLVVAAIAWAAYKSGFRTTEVEVGAGPLKAKMERTPFEADEVAVTQNPTPPQRTEVKQKVSDGAKIDNSPISAPATSGAKINQEAGGPKSEIEDSEIKLT